MPRFRLPPYRVEAAFAALSETIDWGLAAYGVPAHWRQTQGQGVRVAVLDTGITAEHPDLADALDDARDFTRSPAGPRDVLGHGTHVSGIIAARRDGRGVVGVAPQCRLLAAKVLGDEGIGSDAAVAAGIDWAVASGADVLSMSFGAPQPGPALTAAIARAVERGRFVICAAGNAGRPDSVDYPARLEATVAVGAVDRHGRVCAFSSRGEQVDVCAPGQDVLSTYLGGGYAKLSGTSMAAPFVSGVAALLVSKHRAAGGATPVRTQQQLLEHLRRTATDAGPAGKDPNYGYGLINPDSVLAGDDPPAHALPLRIGPVSVNGVRGVFVFVREGEQ